MEHPEPAERHLFGGALVGRGIQQHPAVGLALQLPVQRRQPEHQRRLHQRRQRQSHPVQQLLQHLRYDPEQRLTGIGGIFTAHYDGGGLRTTLTVNNVTTYYLYDDESGGGVPVAEMTSNGTTTTLQALNGTCADGWRLRYVGSSAAYVETYDPQGSIVESSLDNDALGPDGEYAKSVFLYDGFGALTGSYSSSNGSHPAPHKDPAGFGGEFGYYTDLETGLLDLSARYYDGGTGRFVTRDPIGYGGGENLYAFCGNNPINRSDPNGTDQISVHNPDHYVANEYDDYIDPSTGQFKSVMHYKHTDYVIDVPNGQNINRNIAHALRFRNSAESIGLEYEDQLSAEFDYMVRYTANNTVGDYGKNSQMYKDSNESTHYYLYWRRRLAANFNYGAMGAALGWSLTTLLSGGHILSAAHLHGPHYQIEQDAIEDGFWYYFQTHSTEAKSAGIHIPKGFAVKF